MATRMDLLNDGCTRTSNVLSTSSLKPSLEEMQLSYLEL